MTERNDMPWLLRNWLHSQKGKVVTSDSVWERTAGGPTNRTRELRHAVAVIPIGPVFAGGQGAVGRVLVDKPEKLQETTAALRLERHDRDPGATSRRDTMLETAWLSRNKADRYPALIHVYESFLVDVPNSELFPDEEGWGPSGTLLWADVMEWGTSLATFRAQREAPSPDRAVEMLAPVFQTIARLGSDLNLVHRDLDENNVLVLPDGKVKVADWGSATAFRATHGETFAVVAGKLGSLPPEVETGFGPSGPFTDTWSLGRLLLYLITGAESPYLPGARDHRWHPRVDYLPEPLAIIVRDMCAVDHTARPALSLATDRMLRCAVSAPISLAMQKAATTTAAVRTQAQPTVVGPPAPDSGSEPEAAPAPAPKTAPEPGARTGTPSTPPQRSPSYPPPRSVTTALADAARLQRRGPGTPARRRRPITVFVFALAALLVAIPAAPAVVALRSHPDSSPTYVSDYVNFAGRDLVGFYRSWFAEGRPPQPDEIDMWATSFPAGSVRASGGTAAVVHQDGFTIVRVTLAGISNGSHHAATFSWACDRKSGPEPGPGPFVAVSGAGITDRVVSPGTWVKASDTTHALQPAACVTRSADGASDNALATTWTSVTVPAGESVTIPPEEATLDFVVAHDDPTGVAALGPEHLEVGGLLFISDDRSEVITLRFDPQ